MRAYLASIAYADAMVGKLLDAYESSPQAGNTILVLWSDHGWQLGEKQHWRKFALWENVAKCNLMFIVPEGIAGLPAGAPGGAKCSRPVSLQDIYPTLIELCGLPEKRDVSGNSLVPLLENPRAKWDSHAITCLEIPGEMAISTQRYRYIRYGDNGEELYDLTQDKEEWHNLADDPKYAAIKKSLADKLPKSPAPYVKTEKSPGYRKKK